MTDSVNIRQIALEILIEVNEKGQHSHLILSDVLAKYQYLPKQERAFLTRLVEGTLERRIELDYIIDSFSKTKINKMKPLIRNLLRMSVYQIKYMDAVPDSAVCNEAVKIAKKKGFQSLSGFVNGVLRNIAREIDTIQYPIKEKNLLSYLSVIYSMPEWIVNKWTEEYGTERTEEILKAFSIQRPITVRTNLLKTSPEELKEKLSKAGMTVTEVAELPYAFELSGYDFLNGIDAFNEGEFYVQDISSMMVAETASIKKGDYVIDVCAAPGGKSTHLAEMLGNDGFVEARDLTDYKVSLIEDNITRHQLSNMKAVCMDATCFDEASVEKADVLICDLPCSGLGVLGKKNDIRYKMSGEQIKELACLQRKILDTVHSYVKHEGTLIYSTCTIDRLENEDNVDWFIKNHPDFSLVSQKQMLPGEVGADGFFIAKLIRSKNASKEALVQ